MPGGVVALVRIGWLACIVVILGLVIASIPTYYAYLQVPLLPPVTADPLGQLTLSGLQELHSAGIPLAAYSVYLIACNLLQVGGFVSIGGLIFWRAWGKRDSGMALWGSLALITFPVDLVTTMLGTLPARWHPLLLLANFLGYFSFTCFAYLFPTGRFLPVWTRWLAIGLVLAWGIYVFIPAASTPTTVLAAIIFFLLVGGTGGVIPLQIYHYRRVAQPVMRQQIKWVAFGLGIVTGGFILWSSLSTVLFFQGEYSHVLVRSLFVLFQLCLVLVMPLSVGFAVLRYRLWAIDLIINRTLVYSALTVSIVGVYTFVVGYLGTLFSTGGNLVISLLATTVVALLFQLERDWLQRGVNRLMYGQRDDPTTVILHLGQQLEQAGDPTMLLPALVQTLTHVLKLPYAAIALRDETSNTIVAMAGDALLPVVPFPLQYQAEIVGELLVALRRGEDAFSPADQRLLTLVAQQAGMAVASLRLTTSLQRVNGELQRARARLVSAREEERRRLRRDLHDGLGPQLSSQTLLLTTARMVLQEHPEEVLIILTNAIAQSQQALRDIRRLAYALRPPALDDLGLVVAIQEHLAANRTSGIHFVSEMPDQAPMLPAAVEVACYRIVQEAVTNVVRHAHAHTCCVRLSIADELLIEIGDDGMGLPPAVRLGVGLSSMRERAEEVGGHWQIEPRPGGGTCVRVRIPVRS